LLFFRSYIGFGFLREVHDYTRFGAPYSTKLIAAVEVSYAGCE